MTTQIGNSTLEMKPLKRSYRVSVSGGGIISGRTFKRLDQAQSEFLIKARALHNYYFGNSDND